MDVDFDLESLIHVEQSFYDAGYADGHAHGRIHGLIEGRALGREKGFEMWEELGYYEGFARIWGAVLENSPSTTPDNRTLQHVRHLLDLIGQFPKINPSSALAQPSGAADSALPSSTAPSEVDIPKLQRQIRSRYKALCSSVGVRPRMYVADSVDGAVTSREDSDVQAKVSSTMDVENTTAGLSAGSRIPIWKLDQDNGARKKVTNLDLSY